MPNSGLDIMIDTNKLDDLARLYRLYLPVPGGLHVLKKALRESITRRGKELNDVSLGPVGNEGEGDDGEDEKDKRKDKGKAKARPVPGATPAIKWVQDVLDLKDKFDSVWKDAFRSDRDIEAALNEVSLLTTSRCLRYSLSEGIRVIHQPPSEIARVHLPLHRRPSQTRHQGPYRC